MRIRGKGDVSAGSGTKGRLKVCPGPGHEHVPAKRSETPPAG